MEEIKTSNKKRKKPKVKAWCGECYQFFENGPFAKVCKEHLKKGKCNIVQCTKRLINDDGVECTRKFPNINSENRHTHCLTKEEVVEWDEKVKIQNCLGIKRNADINYDKKGDKNSSSPTKKTLDFDFNVNFENLFPQTNNQNYLVSLIDEINNLKFGEKCQNLFELDDKLISEFNNIYFEQSYLSCNDETSAKKNTEKIEEKTINEEINREEENNLNISLNIDTGNSKSKSEEEKIEIIFDKIHTATKIPKSVLNKLRSAFKKKGILNAKILRLYKGKNKSWDFLVDNYKEVCPQIEGVSLVLDEILELKSESIKHLI